MLATTSTGSLLATSASPCASACFVGCGVNEPHCRGRSCCFRWTSFARTTSTRTTCAAYAPSTLPAVPPRGPACRTTASVPTSGRSRAPPSPPRCRAAAPSSGTARWVAMSARHSRPARRPSPTPSPTPQPTAQPPSSEACPPPPPLLHASVAVCCVLRDACWAAACASSAGAGVQQLDLTGDRGSTHAWRTSGSRASTPRGCVHAPGSQAYAPSQRVRK